MTAVDDMTEYQTDFQMDHISCADSLISGNICTNEESSIDHDTAFSSKMENKSSEELKLSDVPETRVQENNTEKQKESPVLNQDSESESLQKTDSDEWLDIMGSGSFKKKVLKPGLGHDTRPNRGDRVIVDISFYVNNKLFDEKKDLRVIVGDLDVMQGIDLVLCLMEKGEKAKVIIPPNLAYGSIGLLPDVPPDSEIECDIEIKEVELIDEDSLSVSERFKLGDEKRLRGNFFYDRKEYVDAIHCYERAAEYLDGVRDGSDSSAEELQEIINMRLKVYNNMAVSHLKLSAYSAALKSLESVLKVQPKNVKALFRKGKILGMQGSTDEAIACMKAAAKIEPDTKIIQVELAKLRNQKKRDEHTQKVMYQRMFRSEPEKPSKAVSWVKKWSMISCGVLAVAIGSAVAYRQYHT